MEIKSTEFERTGKDPWGNVIGIVSVHPYRLHTRRYPNVMELEYRQWIASRYSDQLTPAAMTSFKTWVRETSA
jgi:hypothetical protein